MRFSIDPLVLQRAAAEGPRQYPFTSPEEASEDFRLAVTQRIEKYGWNFGKTTADRYPMGLAKLGLQVLAVFGIAADDLVGRSYWAALWEALGRQVKKRGVAPDDLDLDIHQKNWAALARWANRQNKGRLGRVPKHDPDYEGGRRHVRLPMNHGLLRKEDIQGLPRFFERIGIVPGEDVEPKDLIAYLAAYADDFSVFRGKHARRVLKGTRLTLAAAQVANALGQWDGQKKIDLSEARRVASRLWFSVGNHRLGGGLAQIDHKGTVTEVGAISLATILRPEGLVKINSPVKYHPFHNSMVIAKRSHLDGRYFESRYCQPDDFIILAFHSRDINQGLTDSLQKISIAGKLQVIGKGTEGVPDGWSFYRLKIREDIQKLDVPAIFQDRVKINGARVRVMGGLRVRRAWMNGAGPSIIVTGDDSKTVIIDGIEHKLTDGKLHPELCQVLNQSGIHEVWLPGRRERVRFRVLEPKIARFPEAHVQAGWERKAAKWPTSIQPQAIPGDSVVRGPVIVGSWPPVVEKQDSVPPSQLIAMRLAIALRTRKSALEPRTLALLKATGKVHPNLLVRQLAQAIKLH